MIELSDQAKIAHAVTGYDDILIGLTHTAKTDLWPYAMGKMLYAPANGLKRGALDLGALWLAHRNTRFGDFKPKDPAQETLAFLDLARTAAIGARFEGVKQNIVSSVRDIMANKTDMTFGEKSFLYAASRFMGGIVPPFDKDLDRITDAQWDELFALRDDADAFYRYAQRLMDSLLSPDKDSEKGNDDMAPDLDQQNAAPPPDEKTPPKQDSADETHIAEQKREDAQIGINEDDDASSENNGKSDDAVQSPSSQNENRGGEYHAFTTAYDVVQKARDLGTHDEAVILRHTMDTHNQKNRALINRLARKLEAALKARILFHTERDVEDGTLDTNRLARVVAKPDRRTIYRQVKSTQARNATVSLLIDNSGSMRGRPVLTAAIAADVLALTLERCGVPCEILGFTTANWKGGKARAAWMEAGRPVNPGRLNDLAHIVYKDAATPWRKARLSLALATKDSILKENIDGEALLWATSRLAQRPEPRKILMVISDGAPVDDSTLSANDPQYLERHLRHVVKTLTDRKAVELHAIGIGHDVTHTYPSAVTIRDVEELGPVLLDHLAGLFKSR